MYFLNTHNSILHVYATKENLYNALVLFPLTLKLSCSRHNPRFRGVGDSRQRKHLCCQAEQVDIAPHPPLKAVMYRSNNYHTRFS